MRLHRGSHRVVRDTAALLSISLALTVAGGSAAAFALSRRAAGAAHSAARTGVRAARDAARAVPSTTPTTPARPPGTATAPRPAVESPPYQVVGLGDSVPSGAACDCTPYVNLAGQQLADRAGRAAAVADLAENGLTTSGLLTQLRQSDVRDKIANSDLVIVTIGANDFDEDSLTAPGCQPATRLYCFQPTLATQRAQLSAVLTQVDALQTGAGARTVVTGYWNVFLDGRVGREQGDTYVAASDALTVADNALIASVAAAHADTYVDLYRPFKGDGSADDTALLAPDGDHPNAAGHRLIARTVLDALG